jgi:hypothetical protein
MKIHLFYGLFPEDERVVRMFGQHNRDLKENMGFLRDMGH